METRQTLPSSILQRVSSISKPTKSIPTITTDESLKICVTAFPPSELSSYQSRLSNPLEKKKSSCDVRQWYK